MPLADQLANPHADRVTRVRGLSQRSARRRSGQYLAEGPQAVREAVRFATEAVRELYLTDEADRRWPEIAQHALEQNRRVYPCTSEVAERLSSDAQGVLAVLDSRPISLAELPLEAARLVLVCEDLRDPGNAGTVVRAADAAGADAVIFTSGSVELTNPKVVRSSAGSIFHLPVVTDVPLGEALAALRAAGLTVLAADGGGSHDVETSPLLAQRTAWVLGNEAHGLSERVRAEADALVSIPLRGHAESLNVAMAATVLLYASSRVHAAAGSDD